MVCGQDELSEEIKKNWILLILDVGLKHILPQPYRSHCHSLTIMNLLAIQKTCNLEKSDVLFLRTDGELSRYFQNYLN